MLILSNNPIVARDTIGTVRAYSSYVFVSVYVTMRSPLADSAILLSSPRPQAVCAVGSKVAISRRCRFQCLSQLTDKQLNLKFV